MKSDVPKKLTKKQIDNCVKTYSRWKLIHKGIAFTATFSFKDHVDALVFIARLTVHAQVLNHHPEMLFTYKKVQVTLTTHDTKSLSALDLDFIKRIEEIVNNSN